MGCKSGLIKTVRSVNIDLCNSLFFMLPFPQGSSMVPAIGISVPERSVWHPSTGTLRPDPMGSGYSIPSRAGTHISEPGRGISPGLNSKGYVSGLEWMKQNMTGAQTIYFPMYSCKFLCSTNMASQTGSELGQQDFSDQFLHSLFFSCQCNNVYWGKQPLIIVIAKLTWNRVRNMKQYCGYISHLEKQNKHTDYQEEKPWPYTHTSWRERAS